MNKLAIVGLVSVVFVILLAVYFLGGPYFSENPQFVPGPGPMPGFPLQIEAKAMTEDNGLYNIYLTVNATAQDTIDSIQLNQNITGLTTYINGTKVNAASLMLNVNDGDSIGVNFTMPYTEYSSVNQATVFATDGEFGTGLPLSFQPHLVTDLGWYLHNSTDPVSNMVNKFTIYGEIENAGATTAQNCSLTIRFYDDQTLLQTSIVPIGEINGFCGCTYLNSTNIPCSVADSVTRTDVSLSGNNVS
jgi:hypothetical protein